MSAAHRWWLGSLLLLAIALPARAALDPELKKPYQLEIVLHIADNRALTPLFQEEMERALRDQLRQTFGVLAQVSVRRPHPLLSKIVALGLEQALDSFEQTSETQTHFVLLDYTEGQYRLQTRAYDGMTGQATALVRRVQTGDRAAVPLLAARLIEQGFAPVGTVTPAGKDMTLTLKAGGLGGQLDRWVGTGDVFAVSRVVPEGPKVRATRIAWALLEVLDGPREGVCRCRYLHRFQEDDLREAPGTLGYRALKLATTHAPVRLRFLDDETLQPLGGMAVQVMRPGTKDKAELTTNGDGLAVTRDAFGPLVVVQLPSERVSLPIEVIEGRTVVCRIKAKGGSETLAAIEYRRDAWLRRVYENIRLASERAKELGKDLSKSLEAAKANGSEGLANLETELLQLTQEYRALKRLAEENKLPAKQFDLREGEQRLDELRVRHDKLKDFVQRIDEAIKQGEQNAALSKVLERARLLEAEADYAQAIALYEKVLAATPNQTKVQEYLDRLKQAWALQGGKGSKHEAARNFVYDTWPKLEVGALQENLQAAQQALAALKAADDRLTPRKMLQVNAIHAVKLKKEFDRLRQKDSEESRNQAKVISEVARGMVQLTEDIIAFVGARKE